MLWKLLFSLAALFPQYGPKDSEQQVGFVRTAYGPQTLEEEAVAREALYGQHYEGDIVLPDEWSTTDAAIDYKKFLWPGYPGGGYVPYVLDRSLNNYLFSRQIREAMDQFHVNTCIRFVPRTNEKDYIRIFDGRGCFAKLGRNGGVQDLSLGIGCNYVGSIVHVLGHAIGLFHEHKRWDRDNYIIIHKENVKDGALKYFRRNPMDIQRIFTPYSYSSIMHYGNFAFSTWPDHLPTMEARTGQLLSEPFQKSGLNQYDIHTIRQLYQCSPYV